GQIREQVPDLVRRELERRGERRQVDDAGREQGAGHLAAALVAEIEQERRALPGRELDDLGPEQRQRRPRRQRLVGRRCRVGDFGNRGGRVVAVVAGDQRFGDVVADVEDPRQRFDQILEPAGRAEALEDRGDQTTEGGRRSTDRGGRGPGGGAERAAGR